MSFSALLILNHCGGGRGLGDICDNDTPCSDDLYCEPDFSISISGRGTCAALIAEGESCETSNSCVSGLCDSDTDTCSLPPARSGQECSKDSGCLSDFCNEGVCSAKLSSGEPCSRYTACESGYCDSDTGMCASNPRTCVDSSGCEALTPYLCPANSTCYGSKGTCESRCR